MRNFSVNKKRELNERKAAHLRNKTIGFVFQSFNLISFKNAKENVALPLVYAGLGKTKRLERAREVLDAVGLGDRVEHKPNELSGGQRQRVAIARALVNNPSIILADEPTGNLDTKTGNEIMELLLNLNTERGTTLIIVTHDLSVAAQTDRVIALVDGQIAREIDPTSTAELAAVRSIQDAAGEPARVS